LPGMAHAHARRVPADAVPDAIGYWFSRWVFERGLAALYLVAFACTVNQFISLLGDSRPLTKGGGPAAGGIARRSASTTDR